MVEMRTYCGATRNYPLSVREGRGSLLEGEVHIQVLPAFQLLGQKKNPKNAFLKVETGAGGRVPGNGRARISLGFSYKGSSSGEISGKMAPPQGRDKSQDKEAGKGARSCSRTLGLSVYHETRCQLEICGPETKLTMI